MAKKHTFCHFSSSPSSLAIHKDSHTISKLPNKPKIRIIHLFAPEIIKTDVANFRELVQRLTGKQHTEKLLASNKNTRCPKNYNSEEPKGNIVFSDKKKMTLTKKIDFKAGFKAMDTREQIKEEKGMWFTDLEGLIHELGGDQFPLLPFDVSHMQYGYELGAHLCPEKQRIFTR